MTDQTRIRRAQNGLSFLPLLFNSKNVQISYNRFEGGKYRKLPDLTQSFVPSIVKMLDTDYAEGSYGIWFGQTNIVDNRIMYFKLAYIPDDHHFGVHEYIDVYISSDPKVSVNFAI